MSLVEKETADRRGKGKTKFDIVINGTELTFRDRHVLGRQILSEADFDPADEHSLIRIMDKGSVSIGLDEPVDLGQPGQEIFFAFKSDRIHRFTVDDRGYEWGDATIAESLIRKFAKVDDDEILVLERQDEPDIDLEPDTVVNLDERGTEHLRTAKKTITVCIDGVEKEIRRGVYTTEELIEILGIQDGYVLNVITPDGEIKPLKPKGKNPVREGMKFISHVPQGGAA